MDIHDSVQRKFYPFFQACSNFSEPVAKGLLAQPTDTRPYLNVADRKYVVALIESLYELAFPSDSKDMKSPTQSEKMLLSTKADLLTNLDYYTRVLEDDEVKSLPELFTVRAWSLLLVLKKEDLLPPVFRLACDAPDNVKPEDKFLHVGWPAWSISAHLSNEGGWSIIYNTNSWTNGSEQEDHDNALQMLVLLLNAASKKS